MFCVGGVIAMNVETKLEILAASAKYDVSCSSSGGVNHAPMGVCHSFTADGRCVSLLKILMTNACIYDCQYCVNRYSNDIQRAIFTPEEVAELTISFYRRNYIEGLFLSSSIVKNANYTTELIIETLELLRKKHGFRGYIHAKAIPGTDEVLLDRLAFLADRLSVNIELPSEKSLQLLAPDKTSQSVVKPMKQIKVRQDEWRLTRHKEFQRTYAPAGQSTQMIIGATPDTDYAILKTSENLYRKYALKRVYYSAYIPVAQHPLLPALTTEPPRLREHRLYQADWLMRFYQFKADEILSEQTPNFNLYLDPKANWAMSNYHLFPIDVQMASYEALLRIPGIGPLCARKIIKIRRHHLLTYRDLVKIGVVMKRAQFFIICHDYCAPKNVDPINMIAHLMSEKEYKKLKQQNIERQEEQLSFFGS